MEFKKIKHNRHDSVPIGLSYADAIVSYSFVQLVFAFIPVYVFGNYN
jgi:hypothetical protein